MQYFAIQHKQLKEFDKQIIIKEGVELEVKGIIGSEKFRSALLITDHICNTNKKTPCNKMYAKSRTSLTW